MTHPIIMLHRTLWMFASGIVGLLWLSARGLMLESNDNKRVGLSVLMFISLGMVVVAFTATIMTCQEWWR